MNSLTSVALKPQTILVQKDPTPVPVYGVGADEADAEEVGEGLTVLFAGRLHDSTNPEETEMKCIIEELELNPTPPGRWRRTWTETRPFTRPLHFSVPSGTPRLYRVTFPRGLQPAKWNNTPCEAVFRVDHGAPGSVRVTDVGSSFVVSTIGCVDTVVRDLMAAADPPEPVSGPPTSGDVEIPEHGQFKISEFAQFLNRVGAFMEPTVELPPQMPVIAEYMKKWKEMAVSDHDFANDTVEARPGSGSGPDLATRTTGSASGPGSVSRWLSGMTTAAARLGAKWTEDPKLNNVWKRLSYQINCFWHDTGWKDTSKTPRPAQVTGDCEDLAWFALWMMVESGLLETGSGGSSPPPFTVKSIGLAAGVVDKKVDLNAGGPTVLGSTPDLRKIETRTAHMFVACEIGNKIYVADATARNPVWKWCGRVYWLLMSPVGPGATPPGLSGTYFLADTSRPLGSSPPSGTYPGIDIEPGGFFSSDPAAGKKLVPLASVDSGARMVAEAAAAHDNV